MLATGTIAFATTGRGTIAPAPPDSLRALAAQVGLRVGSAISPFDLDNAAYSKITADQFSAVTPDNEMKWQAVEPTRGTYDWSGGDRLVRFAQAHHQLVRRHVLPGTFAGKGFAGIYDVNLQPKPSYFALQQDLTLAARGAAHRPGK
jgi:endo-1,4-beta-xylanase